jgi:hypothetical protein
LDVGAARVESWSKKGTKEGEKFFGISRASVKNIHSWLDEENQHQQRKRKEKKANFWLY